MADFKRDSWVEGGCDVIQSRHQNKNVATVVCRRGVQGSYFILCCVFICACLATDYAV